ncbi:MAG: ABC transporter permease subunit [Chloroflexota bacterium]|nr:ABC transporter permease subunit [Chloroflexota bacterium]MDE2885034.1 ABC transporter permease subunit [Chloroflexota bacterium]
MIAALFILALRQAVTRRKIALLIVLAFLPLGLAVILDSTVAEGGTLIGPVLGGLVISVTLPITVMVLATSAFGNEVEDRTLSLLTTKPVPRWTIVLSKFAASVVVAAPLMAVVAAVITMMDPDGVGNAPVAAAIGVVVGVVAYASAFTWLGLLTTRALGFGLVYVLLWEALITSFLSGTRYLSIRSYIFGTAHGLNDQAFGEDLTIAMTPALVGAALVTVVFFLLTTRRLSRMDIQ